MNHKAVLLTVILMAAAVSVIAGCSGSGEKSAPAASASAASAAPAAFTTQDLAGSAVDQSIFTGHRLTMVNVWATYCGYCLKEMPGLEQISKDYADKGLQVVGVVADVQTDSSGSVDADWLSEAKALAAQTGASYPQLLPTQSLTDALLGDFSGGTPTTIFFDESGKQLGEAYVGARSESQWTKIVDSLLAQEAAA